MPRTSVVALLAVLVAGPVACERSAAPGTLAASGDEARAAVDAYVVAVNAMDFDSAGSFYSDAADFQWVEDGAIRYRSARESRESLTGLGAMASSTRLTLSDLSVTGLSPGAAVATCQFTMAVGTDGGGGFSYSGAMTIVLRREGGRWLFVSGHTSSPPAGSADGERP